MQLLRHLVELAEGRCITETFWHSAEIVYTNCHCNRLSTKYSYSNISPTIWSQLPTWACTTPSVIVLGRPLPSAHLRLGIVSDKLHELEHAITERGRHLEGREKGTSKWDINKGKGALLDLNQTRVDSWLNGDLNLLIEINFGVTND